MGYSEDFIPDGMNAFERNVKRIGDCIIAGVLLLIFSPLFLICYLVVKREDGGPAIFKQERVGRFGRPFYIYKFRSMRLDAESMGPQLYKGGRDPRLTKVGKFLREHHLDELPQLWNVFCGDMAFIGPRPERKFYIDQIMEHDPRYRFLYQIRPGVTSYATLYNGYTDTIEKMLRRLRYDLFYLQHRSWWFDFKILIKTKKIEVESKDANTIKQPTAYLWAGILTVTIGLALSLLALFMPDDMIANYDETEYWVRYILFAIFFVISILCSSFIFFQLNWRIEIREDEFEYRNLFRRKKVYKYSEVEVKELSRCTRFYRNGKHIVGISFLQDNCDALENAIYKYRKEEKKKQT